MTIRNIDDKLESALEFAREQAEQEYNSIERVGRGLTDEELKRSSVLAKCLEYLEEALNTIKQHAKNNLTQS